MISGKKSVPVLVKTFFFWSSPEFEEKCSIFGLYLNSGKKSVPFFVKSFFFGLHLICLLKKIVFEVYPPNIENRVKLQIIPPNAQQRSAPLSEIIECCCTLRKQLKFFLALVQMKMLAFSFSQFYNLAKTAIKAFTQADRALEKKQFYKQGQRNWHRCSKLKN